MDAASVTAPENPELLVLPVVQPAGAAFRQIIAAMGLSASTADEIAALEPWTQAEADAFERCIHEAFECVEP